jgi:hypothetical protein
MKDDAAPYNVALCLVRLGFYRDAAQWFEEVLRRNPNHRRKPALRKDNEERTDGHRTGVAKTKGEARLARINQTT